MLDSLKKQLKKTGYRCAKKLDNELFLTRDSTNSEFSYLSPESFVEALKKRGLTISPRSLKIRLMTVKKVPTTKKKVPKKKVPKVKAQLPKWADVKKMKYNDLKSFAADFNVDIPGRIKKVPLLSLVKKTLYS